MNVEYNNAGPSAESTVDSATASEAVAAAAPAAGLSPEEQAMNLEEGGKEAEEPTRRRPGCNGYVTVNENDAW